MEKIIYSVEFDEKLVTYNMVATLVALFVSCFGIALLPILLPIVLISSRLQLKHLECDLTNQQLRIKTGAWNRVEKTIPLDKITDMALVQGPIMRQFGIEHLRVETAGSSQGALAVIPAVVGAREFRDLVLKQRDLLSFRQSSLPVPAASESAEEDTLSVLKDIRDSLRRLEEK